MYRLLSDAGPTGLTVEAWNELAKEQGIATKQRLYELRMALKDKGLVREYGRTCGRRTMPDLTEAELGELARMLQAYTPLCQISDMQVRAALELMQQRGWKITRPVEGNGLIAVERSHGNGNGPVSPYRGENRDVTSLPR